MGYLVIVITIISGCINFIVFSFLIASDYIKRYAIFGCLIISTYIPNGCHPYRNSWVRMCWCFCRRPSNEVQTVIIDGSIQIKTLLMNRITPHNTLHVHEIYRFGKNNFYHLLAYVYLKTNVTELTNDSVDVCVHFSVYVTSIPLRVSSCVCLL